MEGKKSQRAILFPLPFQGHINPMIQLANILHSKGFAISIIYVNFNPPDPSSHPDLKFYCIPLELSANEASSDDLPAIMDVINTKYHVPFAQLLAKLLSDSRLREETVACLITDIFWHFPQDVADGLKLPRLVLQTSSACSFLLLVTQPTFHQNELPQQPENEILDEFPPLKVKDLPLIQTQDPEVYLTWIDNVARALRRCAGMILNSCIELEGQSLVKVKMEFQVPTFLIGPFHRQFPATSSSLMKPDESCIPWLDTQKPNSVLYISLGSLMTIDESEFLEISLGLRNSNRPFLWALRPGSVEGCSWLEALPNELLAELKVRGHIVKWAPQQNVLAHKATGGFLTHCGWNSTLESICEGVPMICKPCLGDQIQNARYIADVWKIGYHLEGNITREVIEQTANKLMGEKDGEEMRERSQAWKEIIGAGFEETGSSHQELERLIRTISSTYGHR